MIALRPRKFVNRGSVLAAGFKLDLAVMGITQARRRVLRLWQPGLRVLTSPARDVYFVLLPARLRIEAAQAPGEPLVRHGQLLVTLPLEGKDIEALETFADTVVFARGGRVESIRVSDLKEEDASTWIDTSSAILAEVQSLGAPPAPPVFAVQEYDARRDLPGVPEASSELQEMIREIESKRDSVESEAHFRSMAGALATRVRHVLGRIMEKLSKLFSWRSGSAAAASGSRPSPAAAPPKPGRLAQWMNRTATRLLNLSRLSQFVTRRQARYLARMMEMLESGDVLEGLRHAIPLAGAKELMQKVSFGVPQPRSGLSINPYGQSPSSSYGFGRDFYERLRLTYRQTFQKLEAQGRIEEAAFVLTELLGAHQEAVNFLEKHGRLRLAAELAEGRGMPPATAIRLWWLAGDHPRALRLARRTGEFEAVVRLLERTHPAEAAKLRVLWAERLASAGNYLQAADAILPVPSGSTLAFTWLGQASELGGAAGATALARMAVYFPGSFDRVLPQTTALMEDDSQERARERQTFAEELQISFRPQFKALRERLYRTAFAEQEIARPAGRRCRTLAQRETDEEELQEAEFRQAEVKARQQVELLARLAARALVRDLQNEAVLLESKQLKELIEFTGDASLNADVPAAGALRHRRPEPRPGVPEIAAHDIGRTAITDAALLPNGRLLLALGESGMQLLTRQGRVMAHFDEPAHRLVISADGNRAIAIAPRGAISRLARVDLANRSAAYWCDAPITAHHRDFDGSIWHVACGADLFVIDTLARGFEPLWRIPDMGRVMALQTNREGTRLWVVTDTPDRPNLGVMLWCYELPLLRLRWKADLVMSAYPPEDSRHSLRQREAPEQTLLITGTGAILKETFLVLEDEQEGTALAGFEHHLYLTAASSGKLDSLITSDAGRELKLSEAMHNSLTGAEVQYPAEPESESSDLNISYNLHRLPVLFDRGRLKAAATQRHMAAVPVVSKGGIEVFLLDSTSGKHKLCLSLAGTKEVSLHFTGETLVCADEQGRVLALDTVSNRLVRDVRV